MRNTILIVDDMEVNRIILKEICMEKYTILEAENGLEAVSLLQGHHETIVAVLLDIIMPELDGFGVMDYMRSKKLIDNIPVLMITGETASEQKEKAYRYGITDYINKPFNAQVIQKRIDNIASLYYHKSNLEATVIQQKILIKEQGRHLNEINEDIINTLGTIVEFRNVDNGFHIIRMKEFTKILLHTYLKQNPDFIFGNEEIDAIIYASAMHDIGKIYIPDTILLKPGRLTLDEFETVKTHTTKGCEILSDIAAIDDPMYLKHCCDIALYHHERYDGGGYPIGIIGDDIPLSAQIVSILDVYDALISKRCYKEAYSFERAFHMIMDGDCGVFNPKILDAFEASRELLEEKAKSIY